MNSDIKFNSNSLSYKGRCVQIRDAQWVCHMINTELPHLSATKIKPLVIKQMNKLERHFPNREKTSVATQLIMKKKFTLYIKKTREYMLGKHTITIAKNGIKLSEKWAELSGFKSIIRTHRPNIAHINPNELGVVLSDGSINFQNTESAINYARGRVVKALKQPKPFERGIHINQNRVLREIDGDATAVLDNGFYTDYTIGIHGHPDIYGKGLTTAISTNDFEVLTGREFQLKEIVINSKGEYYLMQKKNGANMHTFEINDDYFSFMAEKFAPKKLQEGIKNIISENLEIVEQSDEGRELIKLLNKKITHKKASVRKKICDATHEFWEKFKDKYEIITETNFSNFA